MVICLFASFQSQLKDTLVGVEGMGSSSLKSFWLIVLPFSFLPRTKQTLIMEGWDPLSVVLPRCGEESLCQELKSIC